MEQQYFVIGGLLFGLLLIQRHKTRCQNRKMREQQTCPYDYMASCEMSGDW